MYPVLFRLGTFEVTSFGVLVAAGAALGLWIFRRELKFSDLPAGALDGAVAGVLAGLAGAKVLWTFEHLGEAPLVELLFSRGGLSWFGGLAGGVATGLIVLLRRGYPVIDVLAASTPALAVGHALGRVGCFLVGDDYGRPTRLPWGVAFPEGLPPTTERVHPTQLYEAAVLVVLAFVLTRWRREGMATRSVLGMYLLGTGAARFAVEFLRIDRPVLLGFTVAHFASFGVALSGAAILNTHRSTRDRRLSEP